MKLDRDFVENIIRERVTEILYEWSDDENDWVGDQEDELDRICSMLLDIDFTLKLDKKEIYIIGSDLNLITFSYVLVFSVLF